MTVYCLRKTKTDFAYIALFPDSVAQAKFNQAHSRTPMPGFSAYMWADQQRTQETIEIFRYFPCKCRLFYLCSLKFCTTSIHFHSNSCIQHTLSVFTLDKCGVFTSVSTDLTHNHISGTANKQCSVKSIQSL